MSRLTTHQLADMRERADKATEGPWEQDYAIEVCECGNDVEVVQPDVFLSPVVVELKSVDDATFIANARQDIPALLTEVEALIAEKAQARRKLDATSGILLEYIRQGQSHVSIEVMQTLVDHLRKDLIDHGA